MAALQWMNSYDTMREMLKEMNDRNRIPRTMVDNRELDQAAESFLFQFTSALLKTMHDQELSQKERDDAAWVLSQGFENDWNLRARYDPTNAQSIGNWRDLCRVVHQYTKMNWYGKSWPKQMAAMVPMNVIYPLQFCQEMKIYYFQPHRATQPMPAPWCDFEDWYILNSMYAPIERECTNYEHADAELVVGTVMHLWKKDYNANKDVAMKCISKMCHAHAGFYARDACMKYIMDILQVVQKCDFESLECLTDACRSLAYLLDPAVGNPKRLDFSALDLFAHIIQNEKFPREQSFPDNLLADMLYVVAVQDGMEGLVKFVTAADQIHAKSHQHEYPGVFVQVRYEMCQCVRKVEAQSWAKSSSEACGLMLDLLVNWLQNWKHPAPTNKHKRAIYNAIMHVTLVPEMTPKQIQIVFEQVFLVSLTENASDRWLTKHLLYMSKELIVEHCHEAFTELFKKNQRLPLILEKLYESYQHDTEVMYNILALQARVYDYNRVFDILTTEARKEQPDINKIQPALEALAERVAEADEDEKFAFTEKCCADLPLFPWFQNYFANKKMMILLCRLVQGGAFPKTVDECASLAKMATRNHSDNRELCEEVLGMIYRFATNTISWSRDAEVKNQIRDQRSWKPLEYLIEKMSDNVIGKNGTEGHTDIWHYAIFCRGLITPFSELDYLQCEPWRLYGSIVVAEEMGRLGIGLEGVIEFLENTVHWEWCKNVDYAQKIQQALTFIRTSQAAIPAGVPGANGVPMPGQQGMYQSQSSGFAVQSQNSFGAYGVSTQGTNQSSFNAQGSFNMPAHQSSFGGASNHGGSIAGSPSPQPNFNHQPSFNSSPPTGFNM